MGGGLREPVAMDFGGENSTARMMPRRIRKRLLEARRSSTSPSSVEEIEAKLREAGLRRQQLREWSSGKAKSKPRNPSWSSQEDDLGQRLEAKLDAAEQKRLSLLAKARKRLARLDELRRAAKHDAEMRLEKEREELGTRVESRVRNAEANRMRLLHTRMQRRATLKERTARSLVQSAALEKKYKERVCSAMLQKRAAAEKKRLGLLEDEKRRAQARVMQAQRVAQTICSLRETERWKMKEQLEDKLQRAKRQRAEYLKQRGSPHNSARVNLSEHGEFLSRKLARCWRTFAKTRKTTFALVKAYEALGIDEKSVRSMAFEQLALYMELPETLQTTKALLDRLESRFVLSQLLNSSTAQNIDHLLKHLASPKRRVSSSKAARAKGTPKKAVRSSEPSKAARYSVRIALCAYMILAHPSCAFNGQGEREKQLMEAASNFVTEFELLVKVILEGPGGARTSRQSSPNGSIGSYRESSSNVASQKTFRSQLAAFDKVWCSYLYCFVAWKVKDAKSLEDDLVRAACQLEVSMMQTCRLTSEGHSGNLSHDMNAIQKQVTDDQKLLREKVQHLSGDAGIGRMEAALSEARLKFHQAKENRTRFATPIAHKATASDSSGESSPKAPSSTREHSSSNIERSSHVTRSLFGDNASASSSTTGTTEVVVQTSTKTTEQNELLLNEILHEVGHGTLSDNINPGDAAETEIKAKWKDVMKRAFWDGIMDSMRGDNPDYSRILGLVKEVRDELCELAEVWREEIVGNIDIDILSQLLESGFKDTSYLAQILEFSLAMVRKLAAEAKEDEMTKSHQNLLRELAKISQSGGKNHSSFIIAVVKGLRFVLEEIQVLKRDVNEARIVLLKPLLQGSAGLEYLQKAFGGHYGPPSNAAVSLTSTAQWLPSVRNVVEEEWNEHVNSLAALPLEIAQPLVATLRAGSGSLSKETSPVALGNSELPQCSGETLDKLLRLGLLHLASGVEGLTVESVPETIKLNALRLRAVQSQYQQVVVIATSMLVLRQILASENSKMAPSELEIIISELVKKLTELFDGAADAGIEEITEVMMGCSSGSSSDTLLQSRKELMTKVLVKSLQNGDAVFKLISRSIYAAFRAVVLGGSGAKGRKLADIALRRVGAAPLVDRVVNGAEVLIKMAMISERVHGPWYGSLL